MNARRIAIAVMLAATALTGAVSQTIDMDDARAREEFQWGVRSFHATRFNDAIVSFNRALAFTPENLLIREWLGRAYFRSGFEDAALNEWGFLAENSAAGAYLLSQLEILRFRRGILPFQDEVLRLSRSHVIRGSTGDVPLFRRPTGIAAEPRGDFFLVSLGEQEVLRINPNGRVVARLRGGLQRLDQPFDVVWHEGELYVSEFGGNRITVLDTSGNRLRTFGERGITPGTLMGPQYMAFDPEDSLLYVTDWGGRRVSVFAEDGEFILAFGRRDGFFQGLERPTGIAVADGRVWVADRDRQGVALVGFDTSGNFLERISLPVDPLDLGSPGVAGNVVEGLSWYDPGRLLITAGDRVMLFDLSRQQVVAEIDDAERRRVGDAVVDANGRVLVSDIDRDELSFFEPEGSLYSGLEVRIERVINQQFPQVGVLVAVHDRYGAPLVGLRRENFVISERSIPQLEFEMESAGQFIRELDVSLIVQSRQSPQLRQDVVTAVQDLITLIPDRERLQLFAAGAEPELILRRPATVQRFARDTAVALEQRQGQFSRGIEALDRTIRLAAAPLINRGLRRNIVLIGDGAVADSGFDEYGIQELGAFLRNNAVRLHVVMVVPGTPSAELRYLVDETDGTIQYLYEPRGLAPMVEDFSTHPSGRYWFTYQSTSNPDFGRAYLEIAAEVQLFVRSGRDQIGFFPPLPQ